MTAKQQHRAGAFALHADGDGLVRWVLYGEEGGSRLGGNKRPTTEAEAREAAAYLAERANKALMAGLRRDNVDEDWELADSTGTDAPTKEHR